MAVAEGETIMAAVLLLILLPIIVSVGFMFGNLHNEVSYTTVAAAGMFALLAWAMLRGAWNMSKEWDEGEEAKH